MKRVQKFRSVEDMPQAHLIERPDLDLSDRIRSMWRRSALLFPRQFPKGVRKYRTLEEADADREAMLDADMVRNRAKRGAPSSAPTRTEEPF